MTAVATAVAALFRDRNVAVDALYRVGGADPGVPVRVIRAAPDRVTPFGESRFVTATIALDVRIADAPGLAAGDTFEIDGTLHEVRGEPVRDAERLVWAAEVRET
ncbi:MAG: hypothetical protein JNK88_02520 [Mangrovicoccus sp.]|nr:hypothetical protein [Mangrovicoccus sp.]